MFDKKRASVGGRDALIIYGLEDYSLRDTMECGQCFRYMRLCPSEDGFESDFAKENPGYTEYMTVAFGKLIFVGQRNDSELIFYGVTDEDFEKICVPYFALDTDYTAIREDIISRTDSQFLKNAAQAARGVRILRQEPWETVFSFIVSQNNNIPRIRKIIREMSAAYGENLAEKYGVKVCPVSSSDEPPIPEKCRACGLCYSFPSSRDVASAPDLMLPSKPGFRFKYLLDAAQRVSSGEIDLEKIKEEHSYEYTLSELMRIKGVGEKVASCASLFAFGNLDAFPIDVWMRRAIDEYFGGDLDPKTLGRYAGVAQQYIFHYIRMLAKS
jgi:N-glycosylase/DNA lyase